MVISKRPDPKEEKKEPRQYGVRRELKVGDYVRPDFPPEKAKDVVHKVIAIKWGTVLLYTPEREHERVCDYKRECAFKDVEKDCSKTHRCYNLNDIHLAGLLVSKIKGLLKLGA